MLFLNQIKKDFQPGTWKKGQSSFRESRVAQVKLKNHLVTAEISEEMIPGKLIRLKTTLLMDRGTIRSSSCTCSAHGIYEKHCRHVAALASWVLAKGSLLRAGIVDADEGSATEEFQATPKKVVIPKTIRAEPVAFVRAIYEDKVLTGITVESALRYEDPIRERTSVSTLHQLIKKDTENYRTTDDLHLKLLHEFIPVIHNVNAPKVTYQGVNMLENLAKLLSHEHKAQIVYHENIQVRYDTTPLKLHSLNVGAKGDLGRLLTYEFRSERFRVGSAELEKLTALGRLSSSYCLVGDTLYRFEKSLNLISQFANRSGMANEPTGKNAKKGPTAPTGFSYLDDDEEYPLHPLSVYRLSLELGVDDFTVDSDWKDFFEWKKTFEADDLPDLPKVNYGFDLRDYQKNGVSWVWSLYHRGLAALLADDMGLGKTHQVLAILTSFYKVRSKPEIGRAHV